MFFRVSVMFLDDHGAKLSFPAIMPFTTHESCMTWRALFEEYCEEYLPPLDYILEIDFGDGMPKASYGLNAQDIVIDPELFLRERFFLRAYDDLLDMINARNLRVRAERLGENGGAA